jgi:hypothetical protein
LEIKRTNAILRPFQDIFLPTTFIAFTKLKF